MVADDRLTEDQKAAAKAAAIKNLQNNDIDFSQVTGDFDDSLENVDNPSLQSLLGEISGGDGNGNGKSKDNKRNNRGQNKKEQKKPQYSTFKYSARLKGALHEAILLNNEPVFLTYSNGHLKTVKQIEEINRILTPPCIEEYPYEPVEFESLEEFEKYRKLAKTQTIDTLYQNIKNTVKLYVDQDGEIVILVSADIFWTYLQDLFPTTHYYDIIGRANGIGKSSIGYMFEGIAYRTVRMTDPSAANLYRVLERIEAGQCTMVLDEADRIHEDRYMMAILKEGYAIGGKVPKINMNTGKQEWFFSYCFKIRIAEDSLSPSTARGLIDRMFVIKAIKGKPTHDIKEVLHPGNRDKQLENLHNDLRHLRKLLLVYRLIHFDDPIVNRDVGLEGRDKELCKPLLQLFHGSAAYNEVETALLTFLDKKNKRKKNVSIDPLLYEIAVNLVSAKGDKVYNSDIWQAIQDNIPGAPIDTTKKPNEYQSYEYDTIYRKTAIKIIESFGAEPDRDHKGRFLKFDIHTLVKTAKQFDIDGVKLQSKLLDDAINTNIQRHIVTPSRPKNDINITGNGETDREIVKESTESDNKEARDAVTVVTVAVQENGPYSCPYYDCNNNRYASEDLYLKHVVKSHKGWTAYPGPPDLDKYRQLLQVKEEEKSKSKIADIAAANQSGDGVLGDRQQQKEI